MEVLEETNAGRLPELIPIRYGRMSAGPFPFLRGSTGLMAEDLASTPASGICVQACGDCHLLKFGLFTSPEPNLSFRDQRLRRDPERAVRVGRQAPGRLVDGRRASEQLHAGPGGGRGGDGRRVVPRVHGVPLEAPRHRRLVHAPRLGPDPPHGPHEAGAARPGADHREGVPNGSTSTSFPG